MDIPAALAVVSGILGLAGLAGAAYAVLRSTVATKTIELWKAQAEALEERLQTEAGHAAECERKLKAMRRHSRLLEDRIRFLAQLIGDRIDSEALRVMTDDFVPHPDEEAALAALEDDDE